MTSSDLINLTKNICQHCRKCTFILLCSSTEWNYQKIFDFIVNKINEVLISDANEFIGILDIFGFESFQTNNFEQFCINYTNESLQEQFNKYIFKLEQIEYENQGIDWKNISFPDNKECLDIIEGKLGIIDMLNEECKLPKGNDINFTQKILKKFNITQALLQSLLKKYKGLYTFILAGKYRVLCR